MSIFSNLHMYYLQRVSLQTLKKMMKSNLGWCQPIRKSNIHFWTWPHAVNVLFQTLFAVATCLHQLVGSTNNKEK